MSITDGSITLIMGPMFSGKTTELINIYNEKSSIYGNEKCLALNYALDKRYGINKIISHNKKEINCHSILDIGDFIENKSTQPLFLKANCIFINEAQFFENLIYYVLFMKNVFKKHIILCGLDLDFQRKKFGQLADLNIYANKVIYLHGKCNTIDCNLPSLYSHRVVENKEQLLIGTSEYIPLCGKCYEKNNSIILE